MNNNYLVRCIRIGFTALATSRYGGGLGTAGSNESGFGGTGVARVGGNAHQPSLGRVGGSDFS